jgi:hypothetical protein
LAGVTEDSVRLARVEQAQQWTDARLWGDGGSVAYERSLEGRVTAMETALRQADALADAARELRRTAGRRWARWVQIVVALAALVTAAASVVAAWAAVAGL